MKTILLLAAAAVLIFATMSAAFAEGPVSGGWTPAEDTTFTAEHDELLRKALGHLVGVSYTGVAYLGSQVVAGTNHCLLCKAAVVVPDAVPKYVLIYIYEDLRGNASIMNIADFDFGALCEY